jgi:hypothetical protein
VQKCPDLRHGGGWTDASFSFLELAQVATSSVLQKRSRVTLYNECIIYEFRSITEVKGAKCPDIQHCGWWTDLHKEFLTRCMLSRKGCRTLHETLEGQTLKKGYEMSSVQSLKS